MTRQHFQFIADIIASIPHNKKREEIARLFAGNLYQTNFAFKSDKFLDACNIKVAK